jgi:choline-glycine betaine transporter
MSRSKYFLPLLSGAVGVFLATIAISLVYLSPAETVIGKITHTVLAEIGLAFIIAAVIIVSVDLRQKEEHHAEMRLAEKRISDRNYLT